VLNYSLTGRKLALKSEIRKRFLKPDIDSWIKKELKKKVQKGF
jgi:hypothetical protein